MARMSQLAYQMHKKMENMKSIGKSRHKEKQNGDHKDKIYSYSTYENYKQVCKGFAKWCKNYGVKTIDDVEKNHIEKYLKHRQDKGLSPYTISRDLAGLNKVLGKGVTKSDCGLQQRSYKKITRSRTDKAKKYNPKNWKEQINVAKGTGIRRQSMTQITKSDFVCDREGKPMFLRVKEKGGKTREIRILESYQEPIQAILEAKDSEGVLFQEYTKKIDNHGFRRQYASARYKELVAKKKTVREDYRGYDSAILKELTKDLGHNRLRVVVEHYL